MSKTMSSLAIGDKVALKVKEEWRHVLGEEIIMQVADKNHTGYPSSTVTFATEKAIAYFAFDAKESKFTNGSADFKTSNIYQWLNSTGAAGEWFTPMTTADIAPISGKIQALPYADLPGFLAMVEPSFAKRITETSIASYPNSATYFNVKMFLPSGFEFSSKAQYKIGATLSLYKDTANIITYIPDAVQSYYKSKTGSEIPNLLTGNKGKYQNALTRDAMSITSVSNALVNVCGSTGDTSGYVYPYKEYAVRPVCNFSSSFRVTDSPRADGIYETLWQAAPSPSVPLPTSTPLIGKKPVTIKWTDPNNYNDVTWIVSRSVDGAAAEEITRTKEFTFTETVSPKWQTVRYYITGVDGIGTTGSAKAGALYNIQSFNDITIGLAEPLDAPVPPVNAKITVECGLTPESTLKVEATNNPYDDVPIWEDCTEAVQNDTWHNFGTRAHNTDKCGLNIRVYIKNDNPDDFSWITGVTGEFN